ncbi:MAG: ankyrin repeat domain-containing protein, partial [Candidatus Omnitrophica bacterium]|nr:ankyrin repeat domain-containing protein [Candidatus Omnitrophota bacterium]
SEQYALVNDVPHGPAKTWYESGNIRSEDNYRHGKLNGDIKRYYENGQFFSESIYVDGQRNGRHRFYLSDGTLKSDEYYKDNLQHGLGKFYYEDGTLKEKSNYKDGKLHGESVWYHPNGTVGETRTYNNGQFEGLHTWYREDGTLKAKEIQEDGVRNGLCQYFSWDGLLDYEGIYLDDVPHGKFTGYYKNGEKHIVVYKKGEEYYGEYAQYWMNGSPAKIRQYVDGKLHGPSKEYYYWTDRIRSVKNYFKGALSGSYIFYDPNGDILIDIETEKGLVTKHNIIDIEDEVIISSIADWYYEGILGSIVRALFQSDRFDVLESIAKIIYDNDEYRPMMYSNIFGDMAGNFGDIGVSSHKKVFMDKLDAWQRAYPESVNPGLLRIEAQTEIAWDFRGRDYARTVSKASSGRFKKAMAEAEDMIEKLVQDHPSNPLIYADWVSVAKNLGQGKAKMFQIFTAGQKQDPLFWPLYTRMAVALLPRWYGVPGELETFIYDSTKNLSEHDQKILQTRMLDRVLDYAGEEFFTKFKFDPDKVLDAYHFYVSHDPENLEARNRYAWLTYNYRDKKRASTAFDFLGDNIVLRIWDEYDVYYRALEWVQSNTALSPITDIRLAVRSGNFVDTYLYFKNGNNVNIQDAKGDTLLHTAISFRQWKIAKFLIESGAKVNMYNDDNILPIHLAVEEGSSEIVGLLIEKDCSLDKVSKYLTAPLHIASMKGFTGIAWQLLKADPDLINQRTNLQKTPAILACQYGQTTFLRVLLGFENCDWEARDDNGNQCLHHAVQKGALDTVQFLLDNELADPLSKNNNDQTPLDMARQADLKDIVTLLEKYELQENSGLETGIDLGTTDPKQD